MVRFSAISLIVVGIAHMFVQGIDLLAEIPRWLGRILWSFDNFRPVREQGIDLALSGAVFWSTVGSFALPGIIFGALLLHADKSGWRTPQYVGWGLLVWAVMCSALMPASGFPVLAALMLVLALGLQRQARA